MEKPKRRRFQPSRSKIMVVAILIITIYGGYFFLSNYTDYKRLKEEQSQLTDQLNTLHNENTNLQEQIEYAKTDSYIQSCARKFFSWIMPGEISFVIDE